MTEKSTATKSLTEELVEKDKKYLWHPFTQMKEWQEEDVLVIAKGEGVYLEDTEGRRYLDGVSSLWCNVHGHTVPEIDEALRDQLTQVAHSTFLGLSNVPAIELAERLVKIAPAGLSRVFYSDSGSEAVEIAVKMAFQYWKHRGKPRKSKFIKLTHSYHGDTIGSVSIGGIDLFHEIFGDLLFETYSIPAPYAYRGFPDSDHEKAGEQSLAALEKILIEDHDKIAALVMEPLMQGAAGMIHQPRGYISRARELATRYNILLIFDEVATGFGRTGTMFAADQEGVSPDLMAVAKGLTGGYLPLAVTLASEEIYNAFLGDYAEFKTFFHGHTYTANPLACRAAIASLDLFEKNRTLDGLLPKIALMKAGLAQIARHDSVGDVRQAGMMAGIELVRDKATKEPFEASEKIGARVIRKAREKGVIIRPLGNVIVLMPPLAISEEQLTQLLQVVEESIHEILTGS